MEITVCIRLLRVFQKLHLHYTICFKKHLIDFERLVVRRLKPFRDTIIRFYNY